MSQNKGKEEKKEIKIPFFIPIIIIVVFSVLTAKIYASNSDNDITTDIISQEEIEEEKQEKEQIVPEESKVDISETEDEQTYFSNSYKNIEDTKKVIEACNRIKNVLTDYIEKLKKLSNEEV